VVAGTCSFGVLHWGHVRNSCLHLMLNPFSGGGWKGGSSSVSFDCLDAMAAVEVEVFVEESTVDLLATSEDVAVNAVGGEVFIEFLFVCLFHRYTYE